MCKCKFIQVPTHVTWCVHTILSNDMAMHCIVNIINIRRFTRIVNCCETYPLDNVQLLRAERLEAIH